jgi:hydantoinase/carbamoylase family amidase
MTVAAFSQDLKINSKELIETIHSTADLFGAKGIWGSEPTQTGVCRLALSDTDKKIKDWFIEETKKLGCIIKIDECGNIFATYPGKFDDKPPTGMGSHLDTQPTGGRYDGIYGVLSGLQVLRTLKSNNIIPNFPITLVDWCNEEGARFPMSLMASSVWAGNKTKEEIYQLKDVYDNETTVLQELKRIGYLGDVECSYKANPLHCHFEIHIEQGPILEEYKKKIGVLTGAQAYNWLTIKIIGMSQHTGTTPLEFRRDALLATAQIITKVNEVAKKYKGLASIAKLSLSPDVVNVVPGEVEFVLDIRHETDEGLAFIRKGCLEVIEEACLNRAGNGIKLPYTIVDPYPYPATHFDKKLVDIIDASASAIVGDSLKHKMVSGAGHDSCATNLVIPTAMIFVPSKEGISHNPREHTEPEELETGFRVLLETILRYDHARLLEEA